jgi:hypothetical protein
LIRPVECNGAAVDRQGTPNQCPYDGEHCPGMIQTYNRIVGLKPLF